MLCCLDVFLFKQKTAYEMRISDWSSDVCSSDLPRAGADQQPDPIASEPGDHAAEHGEKPSAPRLFVARPDHRGASAHRWADDPGRRHRLRSQRHRHRVPAARSEEHTSELQSLMRTSYAVFCLQKKQLFAIFIYTH